MQVLMTVDRKVLKTLWKKEQCFLFYFTKIKLPYKSRNKINSQYFRIAFTEQSLLLTTERNVFENEINLQQFTLLPQCFQNFLSPGS